MAITPTRKVAQPLAKQPKGGVKNRHMESLGNAKTANNKTPTGMLHSKVLTAPKNLGHGKYL